MSRCGFASILSSYRCVKLAFIPLLPRPLRTAQPVPALLQWNHVMNPIPFFIFVFPLSSVSQLQALLPAGCSQTPFKRRSRFLPYLLHSLLPIVYRSALIHARALPEFIKNPLIGYTFLRFTPRQFDSPSLTAEASCASNFFSMHPLILPLVSILIERADTFGLD